MSHGKRKERNYKETGSPTWNPNDQNLMTAFN